MDWILEHLQFVITVAIVFAGWVAQRLQKEAKDTPPEKSAQRTARTAPPPLHPIVPADEQVRRIQEEIRRKIQERAGSHRPPATSPVPAPVLRPVTAPAMPEARSRPTPKSTVPSQPTRRSIPVPRALPPVLPLTETQEAELRQVEVRRRELRKIDHAAIQDANAAQAAGTDGSNIWTSELRNSASLRRALVLREILGPPVSERR